jgi:hypothetical protein
VSDDNDLVQLRNDVRYLKDRLAILDCVNRQARGHDRHDVELMTSVYAPEGIDEHGPVSLGAADYGNYANTAHTRAFSDHLHNLTTHTCEIQGDTAHVESYVIGTMVIRDGSTLSLMGGRYLDRLERREGEWRIALRRCTIEWACTVDGSLVSSGAFAGFIKGSWDQSDPSYARPLTEATPAARWTKPAPKRS